MLCNEGDILVVVCRSTGSVCVLLGACVDVSVCFQEGKSSVWMVCRPCAGLWGVDCGVLNRGLLMLCLGIWLCCVPLCLHSLTVCLCPSLHSSPFSLSFTFFFSFLFNWVPWLSMCIYICSCLQQWFPNFFCQTQPLQPCRMNSGTPSSAPPAMFQMYSFKLILIWILTINYVDIFSHNLTVSV